MKETVQKLALDHKQIQEDSSKPLKTNNFPDFLMILDSITTQDFKRSFGFLKRFMDGFKPPFKNEK